MRELIAKRFDEPDELISHPRLVGQVLLLGETYVGRYIHQPGWRWSEDMKPLVGTPSCQFHHRGIALSGRAQVLTDDGALRTLVAGEAFDIPPGHDAWVLGDEPFISVEFAGAREWARASASADRVLLTLVFTDIVDSTAIAARIGDEAWRRLLARHFERVRQELDRYRGHEIDTTGDGMLAAFDGAARAVRCAASLCATALQDGIQVRTGVHTGDVERNLDNLRGVAVHVAARVMSCAAAGEVLISASTAALLEGSDLALADAGEHELKGLEGPRHLFRLIQNPGVHGADPSN